MPQFTIGQLAAAAGVGVETVRYYQRRGLLAVPARPPGGIRRYEAEALRRLRFVRAAQDLGFSLHDVVELLSLEEGGACGEVRQLAEAKLGDVRRRLARLQQVEASLAALVRRCAETGGGQLACPIIDALDAAAEPTE